MILLQISQHHTSLFFKIHQRKLLLMFCGRLTVSSLKFPLFSSFPFVYLTTHQVPCKMFKMYTSTLKLRTVCCLWEKSYVGANICKYLCRALVFVPAVLSSPWKARQALFVIISFLLSKGTVPLKTGASRPLRASRKGIGIGVNEPFIHYYYFTHLLLYGPRDPPGRSSLS